MATKIDPDRDIIWINKSPEFSEWQCDLCGTGNVIMRPLKGKEPNWFWRKMHFLLLGSQWKRVE